MCITDFYQYLFLNEHPSLLKYLEDNECSSY